MIETAKNAYAPTDPELETWDAIVIGTGMGGATAGYALAEQGWRVLFIEKGPLLHNGASGATAELGVASDDRPEARLARGYWPYPLAGRTTFGEQRFFAPLGCGSGGTTTLYAAQLERMRPEDFRPRAQHPAATDSTLPETWPIEYSELAEYYDRAERLYRVCGTPDPLGGPADGASLRKPPPISERDRDLFESFEKAGLHPYRAHVGCEFVEGCTGCGAGLCPRDCKNDSGRICLMPALRDFGAKLIANCEVVELEADATSVQRVRCRLGDREIKIQGRVVILAAGAFMSPVLLLNSRSPHWPDGLANASGQVGRNLMVHAHAYVAVSAKGNLGTTGPLKSISLNDFYVDRGVKLGTLQSLGISVSHGTIAYYIRNQLGALPKALNLLLKPILRLVAPILAMPFRNAAIFAGIIEDLPYSENRVRPDAKAEGGLHFEYRYPEELRVRSQTFVNRLREVLGDRHRLLMVSGKNNLDYGHVCGTIRFGNDPKTSVLDRDNCAHDVPNLYVVDASFFPSSGGVNLSLTIAANALRVGDVINKRLGDQPRHAGSPQRPLP